MAWFNHQPDEIFRGLFWTGSLVSSFCFFWGNFSANLNFPKVLGSGSRDGVAV